MSCLQFQFIPFQRHDAAARCRVLADSAAPRRGFLHEFGFPAAYEVLANQFGIASGLAFPLGEDLLGFSRGGECGLDVQMGRAAPVHISPGIGAGLVGLGLGLS